MNKYGKISNLIMKQFDDVNVYLYDSIHDINNDLDFVLLDIDMPDADGIAYAKQNLDLKIIFVTNYDTRIKEAFGSNVYGYVSKSNLEAELIQGVNEMMKLVKDNCLVTFKVSKQDINIRVADIIYCQYIGEKQVAVIYRNKQVILKNIKLKQVLDYLGEGFIVINRDTIININKIKIIDSKRVYLKGINQSFEISRRQIKNVKSYFYRRMFNE